MAATRAHQIGQIIDLETLLNDWQASGYQRVSVVESQGQFSQRGGILDIFPIGAPYPTRIELFGDEVESLRTFDPSTQRSELLPESDSHIVISPAREMMPGDVIKLGQQIAQQNLVSDGKIRGTVGKALPSGFQRIRLEDKRISTYRMREENFSDVWS